MPFKLLLLLLVIWFAPSAYAQEPRDDARTTALFEELRCVVCQNQSIADSDADVARDLRTIVREQIAEGRSDGEIKTFLVSRYGEFVLLKPVFDWHTLLLWVTPLVALFLGLGAVWLAGGRAKGAVAGALSSEEEEELARLRGR